MSGKSATSWCRRRNSAVRRTQRPSASSSTWSSTRTSGVRWNHDTLTSSPSWSWTTYWWAPCGSMWMEAAMSSSASLPSSDRRPRTCPGLDAPAGGRPAYVGTRAGPPVVGAGRCDLPPDRSRSGASTSAPAGVDGHVDGGRVRAVDPPDGEAAATASEPLSHRGERRTGTRVDGAGEFDGHGDVRVASSAQLLDRAAEEVDGEPVQVPTGPDRRVRLVDRLAVAPPVGSACIRTPGVGSHRSPHLLVGRPAEGRTGASVTAVPAGEREDGVHPAQLVAVKGAEPAEQLLPVARQHHPDGPCVIRVRRPLHEPLALCAVDQFHHAVVAQLQPVREFADHGPVAARVSLERQHQLVLLGRDAVTAHGLLAEAQVTTDAEAEPGQRFEVLLGQGFPAVRGRDHGVALPVARCHPCHTRNLSCYDTFINAGAGTVRAGPPSGGGSCSVITSNARWRNSSAASSSSPGKLLRRGRWAIRRACVRSPSWDVPPSSFSSWAPSSRPSRWRPRPGSAGSSGGSGRTARRGSGGPVAGRPGAPAN